MVADAAQCAGAWSDIRFYDDRWPDLGECAGFVVAGDVATLRRQVVVGNGGPWQLVVAIGHNSTRLAMSREFLSMGVELATIVHPAAVVSRFSTVGPGSVVIAGATVNARSSVGLACIVNTGAIIDHDSTIAAGVHICPAVALAGGVTVGELVTIGVGACVIQGRTIGDGAVVGAGAIVIRDVEAHSTVVGNPARKI